jgi:hypothetical protein
VIPCERGTQPSFSDEAGNVEANARRSRRGWVNNAERLGHSEVVWLGEEQECVPMRIARRWVGTDVRRAGRGICGASGQNEAGGQSEICLEPMEQSGAAIARHIQVYGEYNIRLIGRSSWGHSDCWYGLGIWELSAKWLLDQVDSNVPALCSSTPAGATVMFLGNCIVRGVTTEGWKPSGVCAIAAVVKTTDSRTM